VTKFVCTFILIFFAKLDATYSDVNIAQAEKFPEKKEIGDANQNDPIYQYELGAKYYYGKEVRQDYNEAFKWFLKSA